MLGGKFTTAESTAFEGLRRVCSALDAEPVSPEALGHTVDSTSIETWKKTAAKHAFSEDRIDRLLRRYGHRVGEVFLSSDSFRAATESVSREELDFAVIREQASSIEDIMRRRLELEYSRGAGLEELPALSHYFESMGHLDSGCLPEQSAQYEGIISRVRSRINEVRQRLQPESRA